MTPLCAVKEVESKFLHREISAGLEMETQGCPPQTTGELRPLDTTYILM